MKSILKKNITILGFVGDIVDVPDELVARFLAADAITVLEPETASIAPAVETAMKPKGRGRTNAKR